jgi:hypothetical protein
MCVGGFTHEAYYSGRFGSVCQYYIRRPCWAVRIRSFPSSCLPRYKSLLSSATFVLFPC